VDDLYWLGVIAHSKEQDYVGSYHYFSRALLIAPSEYWSRLERSYYGRVPSEGNAVDKRVVPELDIAKTIRPDLPFASELLAKFYSTVPLSGPAGSRQRKELTEQIDRFGLDILRAHDLSDLLLKENRCDEAEAILLKILDQDSGGVTSEKIGDLEYRLGRFEQARDWYRRAIGEGTTYPIAYRNLADAFTALKDWTNAERAYLNGIAAHPREASLYWHLGSWYEARNRIADAEAIYRKGCDLPDEIEGSPRSPQTGDVAQCYHSLAYLLGGKQARRSAACIEVLQRGIARLAKALGSSQGTRARKELLDLDHAGLIDLLGERYFFDGQRDKLLSLIDAESKNRPITTNRARVLIKLCNYLGMSAAGLEIGRLAEYSAIEDRLVARSLVDTQLQQMGQYKELFDRLETRRALGEELTEEEYGFFVFHPGADGLAVIAEGVRKNPGSVLLRSQLMQMLSKAGQKQEAWEAYERARDLYFARIDKSELSARPIPGEPLAVPPLPPVVQALPWYTFLLQEGKDDEFQRLDQRLRDVCPKLGADAKSLMLPRASTEFATGRYAAAAESLETCLREKLWNEIASEAMLTGALARSHRALGHRKQAINWYRRAVEVSGGHAGLLAEFLCLVVEDQGADSLGPELAVFDRMRLNPDVMRSATLCCFAAWAALAKGDEKAAFERLIQAETWFLAASNAASSPQAAPVGEEALVCAVLLQIVAEHLADKRAAGLTEFVKQLPVERVRALRELFAFPKRK
jgi:tetratricopeptide (TPR) repeat protein